MRVYDAPARLRARTWRCTWAGYRRSRARFTPHFHRTLAELERTVSRAAATSCTRSNGGGSRGSSSTRARNVPFYARAGTRRRAAAIRVEAIRATLAAIEPLEKQTYRDRVEDFLARDLDRAQPDPRQDQRHDRHRAAALVHARGARRGVRDVLARAARRGRRPLRRRTSPSTARRSSRSARPHPPFWRTNSLEPPEALLALPLHAGEPARTTSTRSTAARAVYVAGLPVGDAPRRARDARRGPAAAAGPSARRASPPRSRCSRSSARRSSARSAPACTTATA